MTSFWGSQTARRKPKLRVLPSFLAALGIRGLELSTKSGIARVAPVLRRVNRRSITFDALVVTEDTCRAIRYTAFNLKPR
jgi:hypothetical protein